MATDLMSCSRLTEHQPELQAAADEKVKNERTVECVCVSREELLH